MRRSLVAVVVGLLALGMTGWTETASAGQEYVFHWNIQGGCISGGACGQPYSANSANFIVAISIPKPFLVTYNEVCAGALAVGGTSQVNTLFNYMASQSYQGRFSQTNIGVNCGTQNGTGIHGNMVFQPGAVLADNEYTYASQRPYPPGSPHPDVRRFRCLKTSIFGLIRYGCVTHLDNVAPYTINQNNEAAWIMTAGIGTTPTRIGGDFNTTSPPSWGSFNEVDALRRPTIDSRAPGGASQKKDWFFGSKANHVGFGNASVSCLPSQSDHCTLLGQFTT